MATIVRLKKTGERFLMLGSGFGVERDKRGFFDAKPPDHVELKYHDMICCSDKSGQIGWINATELQVVEVDGKPVGEYDISTHE